MRLAEAILKVRSYALCGQSEWHFLCPIQYLTPQYGPLWQHTFLKWYVKVQWLQHEVDATVARARERRGDIRKHRRIKAEVLDWLTTPHRPPLTRAAIVICCCPACSSLDDSFPKLSRSRNFDKRCTIQAPNVICRHRFKTGLTSCLFAFHHHSQLELRGLAPEAIYIMLLQ